MSRAINYAYLALYVLHVFTTTSALKVILMWTPFFGSWQYVPDGEQPFTECATNSCVLTRDKSRVVESDAVVFHARDVVLYDMPRTRTPAQRWVFFCMESPPNSYFHGFDFMANTFNWTWTYRVHSDIVLTYGNVQPMDGQSGREPMDAFDVWRRKRKMIFWLVSNCRTHSKRETFVESLAKYVDIDVYGKCGQNVHNVCHNSSSDDCLENLANDYLFVIVFENSYCKDYVSEKVFHALERNIVPIVMSGANYTRLLPTNSVINALNFSSHKDLADYIIDVGSDFNKYRIYFDWKRRFKVNYNRNDLCQLCDKLHKNDEQYKSYDDLKKWWVDDSKCSQWQSHAIDGQSK